MTTPEPSSAVPASTPLTTTQATLPTLGAAVGGAIATLINSKLGALDPILSGTVTTVTVAAVTALFHWFGTKLGGLKL